MRKTPDRYVTSAKTWDEAACSNKHVAGHPLAVIGMDLWCREAKKHGVEVPEQVGRYLAASLKRLDRKHPGWWEDTTLTWQACGPCGDEWRLEDMGFCTACNRVFCFRCLPPRPKDRSKPRRCRCRGEIAGG